VKGIKGHTCAFRDARVTHSKAPKCSVFTHSCPQMFG
jgi:hypothetical protein